MITTLSKREFDQDPIRARKAAFAGPVFITDRGRPSHVLLSVSDDQRMTSGHRNIADALAMPALDVTEFDPSRREFDIRPADLS